MKRRFQKISAFVMTLALVLTSVTWPNAPKASAQELTEADVTISGEAGDGDGHETLQLFTAQQMIDGYGDGLTYEEITAGNVKVYVHLTKSSEYSRLKISGGRVVKDADGKTYASNRELTGVKCTTSTNTSYTIHAGYRTKGGYGSGQGVAESGNYVFPDVSTNRGSASNGGAVDTAGVLLRRMTNEVEGYIIGIIFAGGKSVSIAEDGTITKDFDPNSITLESQTADDSDISDEEWDKAQQEKEEKEKREREAARAGLKSAIDACKAFTEADYDAASLAKVKDAIPAAEAAYAKENDTKENYRAARDTLENVRAKIVPKMTEDMGNPEDFRVLSKKAVIADMGAGINLGNTFDGGLNNATETSWQAYKTTKAYIKALHDAGYNTVRIPVTWNGYIKEDYSIDEAWIGRVQEVVDYCVDQDMYAIINIHHDGAANHDKRGNNPECWLNTYADDIEGVYTKFAETWKTLANRFKDYDEHLIFESMNEVTDAHDGTANEDAEILNNLNQIFVNAVRATGSNNTKRWLAFTGRFATAHDGMTMPDDPLADSDIDTTRLMFAVHIYKDNSAVRWTRAQLVTWQSSLSATVSRVDALSKDIPIYVGEYGVRQQAQSGSATGYNNAERALNSEFCNAVAKFYGVCPVVWDQGDGNYVTTETNTGLFNYWNRPELKPVYDDIVHGMIRGTHVNLDAYSSLADMINTIYMSYGHSSISDNSVSKDPDITEITNITVTDSQEEVEEGAEATPIERVAMKAGDRKVLNVSVEPADTNDLVLWSTDDDAIATVYDGNIRAKAAGITTIHAYSQSKSVTKDIQVIVSPSGNDTATGIKTDKAYYELTEGGSVDIVTTLLPAESKDKITYTSSNPDVATVSSTGRINAENTGSTYITITAASGVSTIVKVQVNKSDTSNSVEVALNVMIGATTETSQSVWIKENGQYELSYDMATELSDAGKEAGLTALKDMTSVYIRDCNKLKPVVQSAKIRYDEIIVDGVTLTNKKTDAMDEDRFKNLLKESGQLDSNDPINGWDGSAVEEVTTNSNTHTASFTGMTNPQKITVKFTIKDLEFFPISEKENEATEMEAASDTKIALEQVGDSQEVELTLKPANTDSFVTFYSTNSAVVAVDNTAQRVDKDGKVKVSLTAISEGTAIITAITENGLKVFFSVGVGDVEIPEPYDPTPPGLDGSEIVESPAPSVDPGAGATVPPTPLETPAGNLQASPTPGAPATKTAQTITVKASISKAIGSKAFNLGAKTSGDGALSYVSSDTKVATVDASGKVTIKTYGTTNITVTAAETAAYTAAQAVCVLKVVPKTMSISKVKAVKGKKMQVTWKQNKQVTGYQIQYSQDKKFKKKASTVTISKNKTKSTVIKKLKKGKYFVRIRAYKKVGKTKLYSSYSKVKKVTIK